ncbi:hypothetical protein KAX17_17760 [Candidatus Bipolaricaulota bacterium]|nr:hypothetical protein [Candidatus Bipolaricaulota bacterium]
MKIETSSNQRSDALASLGNQSYWSGWLAFLEMEIESRKEVDGSLADAACYVSWLLLSAEYIFYRLRWYFYVAGNFEDEQIFDDSYNKLFDKCAKVMPTDIREHVQFAVKVRHIFVHKGFPNPQEAPTKRINEVCGEVFCEADIRKIRNQIENPANYEKVKSKFQAVRSWLKKATPDITFGA